MMPRFKICLQDIDKLVNAIFTVGSRNKNVYLRFSIDDGMSYLNKDNAAMKI